MKTLIFSLLIVDIAVIIIGLIANVIYWVESKKKVKSTNKWQQYYIYVQIKFDEAFAAQDSSVVDDHILNLMLLTPKTISKVRVPNFIHPEHMALLVLVHKLGIRPKKRPSS